MTRRIMAVAALVILAMLPFVLSEFYVTLMNYIGLASIVTIGLVLLTGVAGLTSFGQAAFVGIGAYTTALFTTAYGLIALANAADELAAHDRDCAGAWLRHALASLAPNSSRARGAPTPSAVGQQSDPQSGGQQSDPRSGRPARAGWAALRQFRFWGERWSSGVRGERSIMRPPRRRARAGRYGVSPCGCSRPTPSSLPSGC